MLLLLYVNTTGNSPAQVAEAREADSLYCAHGSVLYPGVGLGALWGGVMVPKASASGSKDKVCVVIVLQTLSFAVL
jgi:hypothetical protein